MRHTMTGKACRMLNMAVLFVRGFEFRVSGSTFQVSG
jgi:hypothetical protein